MPIVIPRKSPAVNIRSEGEEVVGEKVADAAASNQGSDKNVRGKNWAKNRERRERLRIERESRQQGNATPSKAAHNSGSKATSLIGAKSAIRDRLNMMYKGMRGLEAAHEAFALCGVGVAVNLEEPSQNPQGKRSHPHPAPNGGKYGKKKRFEHAKKSNVSASPVEKLANALETEVS